MDLCVCRYKVDNPTKDYLWCFYDKNVNSSDIEFGDNSSQHFDDDEPTSKAYQNFIKKID